MNAKLTILILGIALYSSTLAQVHEEVQAAMDWKLPPNDCTKPELRGYDYDTLKSGGYTSRASTNISSETSAGGPAIFDLDYYTIERYERKIKRWEGCVGRYKEKLLRDFVRLKDSAQYGLTESQATAILGKLAEIQKVVISRDGLAPTPR